jgi:tetratricopeptide (TPR) repeat protein
MKRPDLLGLALCAGLAIAAAGCATSAANPAQPAAQPSAPARAEAKHAPETPQQSIAKLTSEIAAHPKNAFLHVRRASCYLQVHDRGAADHDFARAIELQSAIVERNSADPNPLLERSRVYADWGKYDSAISDVTRAIDLEPDAAGYRLWRSNLYMVAGDLPKALDDCNDAVQMQPFNGLVWSQRGWAYAAMGKNRQAIADLTHALQIDPHDPLSYARRGFAYGAEGNYAQARADFDQAIRLDGNNPVGYGALAWLLATAPEPQFRDGAKAVAYAERARTLYGGKAPWISAALAAAQAEDGHYDAAIKTQDAAIAATPAQFAALTSLQQQLLADYKARKPYHGSFAELKPVLPYIYARD